MRIGLFAVCGILALSTVGSCGPFSSAPTGPTTAAARAEEERAASTEEPVDDDGKSWGGWRYQGARDDCFFVVDRKCYTTLDDACGAAACKNGCATSGAGPTIVSCR